MRKLRIKKFWIRTVPDSKIRKSGLANYELKYTT